MLGSFQASAGASLHVALLAAPSLEARRWLASSDAGSGLPWWSPIAVTLTLLLLSLIYRFRHRPAPPAETPQPFENEEPLGMQRSEDDDPRSFFWKRSVIGEHRNLRQV